MIQRQNIFSIRILSKKVLLSFSHFKLIECEQLHEAIQSKKNPYKILHPFTPSNRAYSINEVIYFLTAGHIPGAQFVNLLDISDLNSPYSYMVPSNQQFSLYMEHANISKDDQIIIYDESILVSTRFNWLMKSFGHQNVSLLNGGLIRWKQLGFPLQKGTGLVPSTQNGRTKEQFQYQHIKNSEITYDELSKLNQKYTSQNEYQIFDSRRISQHSEGKEDNWTHLPIIESVLQENSMFKSVEEISEKFANEKIDFQKTIIHTCRRGVQAALADFSCGLVAQYRGVPYKSMLYDGSWEEWSQKQSK